MNHDDIARSVDRRLPGARVLAVRELRGGSSAEVRRVDVRLASGELRSLVLRRPPASPEEGGREPALHRALHDAGFPVPAPVFVDGATWAMPFIDGVSEVADDARSAALDEMAAFLVRLHTTPVDELALPALPGREDARVELLATVDENDDPDLHRALSRYRFAPARTVALHGDFWPGNVLWRAGRIVAVLDWEDAAVGDALSDLACSRVELAAAYGDAAVERFTRGYVEATGFATDDLELWDLFVSRTALAAMHLWNLTPAEEADRRAVTQAFAQRARAALLSRAP